MKYYDFFVPMGAFCATSYHLRHNDLQTEAYPLDWVGVWKIKQAAELITSGFDGFFIKENLKYENTNGNHSAYTDTKNNFAFFHCIDKNLPFDEGYIKAKDMFDRRIERITDRISKAKKLLFVYANNEAVSHEESLEAYDILKAKYPDKNIDLLVMDLKLDYKGVEYTELSKNVTFIKMEFDLANDLYSGRKEVFTEIFSNYQIASLSKRIKYFFSKIVSRIKRIIISLICCFIPSKAARKSFRRKLKTDKLLFDK